MKNDQLKPGYNVQIGTEDQFIVGFSIHQKPGDTTCMKEHLETLKNLLGGNVPKKIISDASYGSDENYEYLNERQLDHYVKYNTFHKEASTKWKADITNVQNFKYIEDKDEYVCGYDRTLVFLYEHNRKSDNGYKNVLRVYECLNCSGCPHKDRCVKSEKPFAKN